MLDGLLGRGFSSKCKSLIKPTRTRIDVLRRRQEATQRFLKGNLAQLLANGLDINAFGRTEEFIAGLNVLSCYDFIEWCCDYILKQLSLVQKQRECPEECREAVGSLMYAAARFSDMPELRDLRDLCQERYGNGLEHFVNHELVEKLTLKPPTMEKKLQMLQDIALEFSIKWDFRGFQQRMTNPSAFAQDQPKRRDPIYDTDDKCKLPNGKDTLSKSEKQCDSGKDLGDETQRVCSSGNDEVLKGIQFPSSSHKSLMGSKQTTSRRDYQEVPSRGKEVTDDKDESSNYKENTTSERGRPGRSSHGKKPEFYNGEHKAYYDGMDSSKRDGRGSNYHQKAKEDRITSVPVKFVGKDISSAAYYEDGEQNSEKSTNKFLKEETGRSKSCYTSALPPLYVKSKDNLIPPPYTKSRESRYGTNAGSKHGSSDSDGTSTGLSIQKRVNLVHGSERMLRQFDQPTHDNQALVPEKLTRHDHEKDVPYYDDIPLPRPRSMRRKHSKSSSRDNPSNSEDAGVAKESSSSRRRDGSRRGLQILFEEEHHQRDDEERMIDKLLLHYSRKPSNFDPEKLIRKPKAHPSHHTDTDAVQVVESNAITPPTRSISLPREKTAPIEPVKVYARANSFQPHRPATHVHPKLPDYDDLAARFAALKGC